MLLLLKCIGARVSKVQRTMKNKQTHVFMFDFMLFQTHCNQKYKEFILSTTAVAILISSRLIYQLLDYDGVSTSSQEF